MDLFCGGGNVGANVRANAVFFNDFDSNVIGILSAFKAIPKEEIIQFINNTIEELKDKANSLPFAPGVYIMRDKSDRVIYVGKAEADQIQSGDVITFRLENGAVATHRVTEVIQESDGLQFRTKGDANPVEDAQPVSANQIIGKPLFCVPYLGRLSSYIQTPKGTYTAIAVAAGMLILVFLPDLLCTRGGNKFLLCVS